VNRERQSTAYLRVADAGLHAGNCDVADLWYRRVLEMDPVNAQALRGLAAVDRHCWLRRRVIPAGGILLALLVVAVALVLVARHRGEQPEAGAAAFQPQELTSPAPAPEGQQPALPLPADPQEAVQSALKELRRGLATDDLSRLAPTAQALVLAKGTWDSQAASGADWTAAAARLAVALEACQTRRWAAAAEHLAALPDLPGEGQQDLSAGRFLALLRAGEADLAHHMNPLFSRAEYLRAADAHFAMAREISETLPPEGDWAERLAGAPLHFFADFEAPRTLHEHWSGLPEATAPLDGRGNLLWSSDAGAGIFSRAGADWRDYDLVVRLRPEGEGRVGLGVRCADAKSCCVVWLPVGTEEAETGEGGASWWMACRAGDTIQTHRPQPSQPAGEGTCLLSPGEWHLVAVTVAGNQAALTCDGVSHGLVGGVREPEAGGIGLFAEGPQVLFDYVAVTDPPALPRN